MSNCIQVSFPGASDAEKGQLVSDLQHTVEGVEGVQGTSILRERSDTQDAGTILSIVLGAPAVVLIVEGIANWMNRKNQGIVEIETENGKISLRNMNSEDVNKAIAALTLVLK